MPISKKTYFGLITLFLYFFYFKSSPKQNSLDPFVTESSQFKYFQKHYSHKTPIYQQKITDAGFVFEEHKILTKDGYILTAWRIPRKLNEPSYSLSKHEPIILQHGLFDSSFTWLLLDNEFSLPIMLANSGYDVWLTNTRGNAVSFEHQNMDKYNSNDVYSKYWDFSFHEMAIYDLPANINYIRKITGYDKVTYIGHSQGGLIYNILYSLDHQFIDNTVKNFISVGTVAGIFTTESKLIQLGAQFDMSWVLNAIKVKNFFTFNENFYNLISTFCYYGNKICSLIVNFIVSNGKDTKRIIPSHLFKNFLYAPGGTSFKNISHWLQMYKNKRLAMYDYGRKKNIKLYGSPIPPEYDFTILKQSKIRSLLYVSDSDPFSNENDLKHLTDNLNRRYAKVKKMSNYNHLDFLWSEDAKNDIYKDIVSFIQNGNKSYQ